MCIRDSLLSVSAFSTSPFGPSARRSSSSRMGAPSVTVWMPMTLTMASTSMISSAVAPRPRALRMCSFSPGSYRCVAEASKAM